MSTDHTTNPLAGYGIGVVLAIAAGVMAAVGYVTFNLYSQVGGALLFVVALLLIGYICVHTDVVEELTG